MQRFRGKISFCRGVAQMPLPKGIQCHIWFGLFAEVRSLGLSISNRGVAQMPSRKESNATFDSVILQRSKAWNAKMTRVCFDRWFCTLRFRPPCAISASSGWEIRAVFPSDEASRPNSERAKRQLRMARERTPSPFLAVVLRAQNLAYHPAIRPT